MNNIYDILWQSLLFEIIILKRLNVLSWSQKHLLLKVLYLNNFFVFTHIQLFIGKGLYLFKNNGIVK